MNIPTYWSDINISQLIELYQLDSDDFENSFELNIEILSIVCDIDNTNIDFEEMDIDELVAMLSKIKWLSETPPSTFKKKIATDTSTFEFKDLNKITVGEFIDVEHFKKDKNDITNIHLIAALLYKQVYVDEWGNTHYEPNQYDVYKRSEMFLRLPVTDIIGILIQYNTFRENIMKQYPSFFGIDETEEPLDMTGLTAAEIAAIENDAAQDKIKAEWAWQRLVFELAGEDVTKMDAVTDQPLILVLNTMAMKEVFKQN